MGSTAFIMVKKPNTLSRNLALEDVERRVFDGAAQMRAGVIDENVDAPEGFERAIDEYLGGAWVGYVGDDADGAALGGQFSYRRVKLRRTATANCNGASFVQQRLRHGFADAARRTGDEGDLTAQAELHDLPHLLVLLLLSCRNDTLC